MKPVFEDFNAPPYRERLRLCVRYVYRWGFIWRKLVALPAWKQARYEASWFVGHVKDAALSLVLLVLYVTRALIRMMFAPIWLIAPFTWWPFLKHDWNIFRKSLKELEDEDEISG